METKPSPADVVAKYLGLDTSVPGNFALVMDNNSDITLSGASTYRKDLLNGSRCQAWINLPLRKYSLQPSPPFPYTTSPSSSDICFTRMIHVDDKKIAVVLGALALVGYQVEALPNSMLTDEQKLEITKLLPSLNAAYIEASANTTYLTYSKL